MCRNPNCGSFIREKSLSFGKDFVTVLKDRYCDESLGSADGDEEEELTIQGKVVEIVGLEKIIERHRYVCVRVCVW